jgi:hypothetical protein
MYKFIKGVIFALLLVVGITTTSAQRYHDGEVLYYRAAYRAALIAKSEKSLLELVEGAKSEDTKKEYLATEDGRMILAKKTVIIKRAEPNVAATIFTLTNLKGDVWKNKQNTDITTNGKELQQQISPAEAAALLKQIEQDI